MSDIIAILAADFHLSLHPPIWRSVEKDWLGVMKHALLQIHDLQQQFECPILCGGDIFDRWNAPPELINWALQWLPDNVWSVAGQHDLPLHQLKDIEKSAYWTLACAEKIRHLTKPTLIPGCDWVVYPFHYGQKIIRNKKSNNSIALIHKYVWIAGHEYSGARLEDKLKGKSHEKWKGYDVAVFGDNHNGFIKIMSKSTIFNCGTLLRRKSNEKEYCPQVGLLRKDGQVDPHWLDTKRDKYLNLENDGLFHKETKDVREFFQCLEELGTTSLDFAQAVKEYLQTAKVDENVKRVILKSLENIL